MPHTITIQLFIVSNPKIIPIMKNLFNTIKAIVCVAFLACTLSLSAFNPVDGNGNVVTQSYDVTAFDQVL